MTHEKVLMAHENVLIVHENVLKVHKKKNSINFYWKVHEKIFFKFLIDFYIDV